MTSGEVLKESKSWAAEASSGAPVAVGAVAVAPGALELDALAAAPTEDEAEEEAAPATELPADRPFSIDSHGRIVSRPLLSRCGSGSSEGDGRVVRAPIAGKPGVLGGRLSTTFVPGGRRIESLRGGA